MTPKTVNSRSYRMRQSPFDFHVVIDSDTHLCPLGLCRGLHREGRARRAVERRTPLRACTRQRREGVGMQRKQEGRHGRVDLGQ
jgi:hypothetical protein